MKVLELTSQTVITVNDSYGARLIEQGKAVIPSKTALMMSEKKPAEDVPAQEVRSAKKR